MTIDDVIRILGNPNDTTYDTIDTGAFNLTFFTENKSVLRPAMPTIYFDRDKRVVDTDYGDQ
jgi:hypothetical protein